MLLDKLEEIAIVVLCILCIVLGLAAFEYKRLYKATDLALTVQNQAIEAQKKQAAAELAADTKQVQAQATTQKATDEIAIKQIAAVATPTAPVRVRYVSVPTGCSGPSPKASGAGPGAADTGTTSGVLAPAAQLQFDGAVTAVETLQAAFNSCKATLTGAN